ncbi:MAG TPA: hypothetical protein VD995_09055 [Azospirillum sp.]|nr:hypothetical protein [Azospirillum sp.]
MTGRYTLPITAVPPVDLSPYAPRHAPAFTGTSGFAGPVRLEDGSAPMPALAFVQDVDTGLTRPAPDTMGMVAGGTEQFRIAPASAAVNLVQVSGAPAGGSPIFAAIGADTHIGFNFHAKNGGGFVFNATGTQFLIATTPASVNYLTAIGGATGTPPTLQARGTDAAIDIALTPKGSGGRVRFGGYTAGPDAPVTGWIEIRDSAGTIRKLAVIA